MKHVVKLKKEVYHVVSIDIHCGNCNTYFAGSAVDTSVGTVSAKQQKRKKRNLTCFKAEGPWIEISGGLSFLKGER